MPRRAAVMILMSLAPGCGRVNYRGFDSAPGRVDSALTDAAETPLVDAGPVDSGIETGSDSGMDASHDSGSDSGMDASHDSGSDSGMDASHDSGSDSGTDTGRDSGADTGRDSGADTGRDSGSDTGTPPCRHILTTAASSTDLVATFEGHRALGTGDYTYEAWVRPDPTQPGSHTLWFGDRTTSSQGQLFGTHYTTDPFMQVNGTNYFFAGSIRDGAWHHVALVRVRGTLFAFVDFVAHGTMHAVPESLPLPPSLVVGNDSLASRVSAFRGGIYMIRVWSRARTPDELRGSALGSAVGSAGLLFELHPSLFGTEGPLQAWIDRPAGPAELRSAVSATTSWNHTSGCPDPH